MINYRYIFRITLLGNNNTFVIVFFGGNGTNLKAV